MPVSKYNRLESAEQQVVVLMDHIHENSFEDIEQLFFLEESYSSGKCYKRASSFSYKVVDLIFGIPSFSRTIDTPNSHPLITLISNIPDDAEFSKIEFVDGPEFIDSCWRTVFIEYNVNGINSTLLLDMYYDVDNWYFHPQLFYATSINELFSFSLNNGIISVSNTLIEQDIQSYTLFVNGEEFCSYSNATTVLNKYDRESYPCREEEVNVPANSILTLDFIDGSGTHQTVSMMMG